jgi:hypothetical protein
MPAFPLELERQQHHLNIPKAEKMPPKSAPELEAECLRLVAMDPHTARH